MTTDHAAPSLEEAREPFSGFWLIAALLLVMLLGLGVMIAAAGLASRVHSLVPAATLLSVGAATLACVRRGQREPAARAGWFFIALAVLAAGLSPLHAVMAVLPGGSWAAYPTTGDWASFLSLPLAGIGILCLSPAPLTSGRRVRAAMDALLFGVSLLFLLVALGFADQLGLSFASPAMRNGLIIQLGLGIADAAIILYLLAGNAAALKGPIGFLLVALLLSAIPPLLALRQLLPPETYHAGNLVHLADLAALLLVGLAALSPGPGSRAPVSASTAAYVRLLVAGLPFAPFAAALFTGLWLVSGNRLMIWSAFAAYLLLIARLTMGMFDYWELSQTLEDRVRKRTAELEASRARLAQAERLEGLGRLAGGVAHDFNNMLTAILGYAQLLRVSIPEGDRRRDLIGELSRAGERAASLTKQLLTFARQQPTSPRVLNPARAIEEMRNLLKYSLGQDISLTVEEDADLWNVKIDPHHFEQVVLNLSLNARDAMPNGGLLLLETRNVVVDQAHVRRFPDAQLGPHVRLRARDTGTGIPLEAVGRIFEPFFTTKDQGDGTGLGLAICYGIVKEAGGHIAVETEVARGTNFDVYLPRTTESPEAQPGAAPREAAPDAEAVILVAEDEPSVRKLLKITLASAGYETLLAENGTAAVELAQTYTGRIDLFLTDMAMPGMSGLAAARLVRACHPETRIVAISGYSPDAAEIESAQSEQIPLLPKPISPLALLRTIRDLLKPS